MNYILNTFFPVGLKRPSSVKDLNENTDILLKLLDSCPEYKPTDLYNKKTLAENLGLKSVIIKDERKRFNLGSFKATGAIYAIAKIAYKRLESEDKVSLENLKATLRDVTFATASAGKTMVFQCQLELDYLVQKRLFFFRKMCLKPLQTN
ncbi:MAG: hypothetical protein ACJZ8K_06445 [Paracoccaceae bacterium]